MHEELLKHLLETASHVNHKVAEDWLGNTILMAELDQKNSGEVLSEEAFTESVMKTVKWHIKRLNGLGGSDMSVLHTEFLGGFYPHGTTAADIVANKLGLQTPHGRNGDTERGIRTEEEARRKFILKMSDWDLELYHEGYEALDKLKLKGGVPNHEWMQSSPDGIYRSKKDGSIWLVDFKTPAVQDTVDEMISNPPDYYRAQLAQYKYHLEAAGVVIDHTALVPFSTKQWDVEVAEFTVTDKLMTEVLGAGDHYWKYVLKNELPRLPPSENFQFVGEMPVDLQQVVAKFALVKKMDSIIKKIDKNNKSALLKLSSIHGVQWDQPEMKTRIPGVDITTKSSMKTDNKAIAAAFRELGGDPDDEQFKIPTETTTVSLIRSKKNPHAEFLGELEELGIRAIDFAIADMMDVNDFHLTDSEIDRIIKDPASPVYEDTVSKGASAAEAIESLENLEKNTADALVL